MKELHFSEKTSAILMSDKHKQHLSASSRNEARTYSALKTDVSNDVYCVTLYLKRSIKAAISFVKVSGSFLVFHLPTQ